MFTRREFLSIAVVGSTHFLTRGIARPAAEFSYSRLQPFIDPLPIPSVLKATRRLSGQPYYEIPMTEFRQRLHSSLPPTRVWGYAGTFPGPTIEARKNEPVYVRWVNRLPHDHLLHVDPNVHGAHDPKNPSVRTVVHLHGASVPPESDGFPEEWFPPGGSSLYFYPNRQRPTTLWYHDHSLGITRLNVYAGLAGLYLLRDETEERFNLPRGQYEIPLIIQDRSFSEDGQLRYPHKWQAMFFGRTALVNGAVWPFLEVEPRKYRFRILNASNGRFFQLKLFLYHQNSGLPDLSEPGPPFFQIGTDGGLLPAPVVFNNPRASSSPRLLLGPAERADVVIDFAGYEGKALLLHNDAASPFRGANFPAIDEAPLPQIMLFRVRHKRVTDSSSLPTSLVPFRRINPKDAVVQRNMTLDQVLDQHAHPIKLLLNETGWSDPPTETPTLGTTEIWNLLNLTGEVHPIHLHLIQFQILSGQQFDVSAYQSRKELRFRAPARTFNQAGWKDTVAVNPGEVVRIIAKFSRYSGLFVWHCHILEHEDNDMMRPLQVLPA